MIKKTDKQNAYRAETQLVLAGRSPELNGQFVSPPVVRASTVLFENTAQLCGKEEAKYTYGLTSTPTIEALVNAINDLEDAYGTVIVPSGLAACTVAIMAAVGAGDQILMPDNVYSPTRRFCDHTLRKFNIDVTYYDPLIGDDISSLFKDNIKAIFMEAPGSHTFEMPNVKAFVAAAKEVGATTLIDNTWASPLLFKPVPYGIDYSIQAATKYLAGHSDALIGSISTNEKHWHDIRTTHQNIGVQGGTEEMYLTLRGMRTMALRMDRQEENALTIAHWLQSQPEVARVLHPALPDDPGHEIWKELIGRSSGLFGFVLRDLSQEAASAMLDGFDLFGLGYSWGGFESLAVLSQLDKIRTTTKWTEGPTIRLSIGLEHPEDLMDDLRAGLDRAKAIG